MRVAVQRKAVAVAMTPELAFVRIGGRVSGVVPGGVGVAVHARAGRALVSPGTAESIDGPRELPDPQQQRFAAPFVNCPNCGPWGHDCIVGAATVSSVLRPNQDGGDVSAAWVASHRTW